MSLSFEEFLTPWPYPLTITNEIQRLSSCIHRNFSADDFFQWRDAIKDDYHYGEFKLFLDYQSHFLVSHEYWVDVLVTPLERLKDSLICTEMIRVMKNCTVQKHLEPLTGYSVLLSTRLLMGGLENPSLAFDENYEIYKSMRSKCESYEFAMNRKKPPYMTRFEPTGLNLFLYDIPLMGCQEFSEFWKDLDGGARVK